MSQLASTLSRTQQEYAAQSRDRKAEQMTHARQVQEISMQLESALQKLERVQMQERATAVAMHEDLEMVKARYEQTLKTKLG
eukprot:CAMPEP_0114269158 /NCGR_PEP_ID=MMETSP0058-20121206/26428_1 /TAXON_ID=36894 /ORGANISM="Pyramimonas parkeae, CCMP726" /LENGTH=81 /DNA_ID=CAMNT_0001387555 /DNA_START=1 /DNA_END=242 /DNA_ORIENTATION=-